MSRITFPGARTCREHVQKRMDVYRAFAQGSNIQNASVRYLRFTLHGPSGSDGVDNICLRKSMSRVFDAWNGRRKRCVRSIPSIRAAALSLGIR